jgi:formate hydrogenlyase subunit 3/multisubunit Na+/H+ antiporter MnhD subunit
MNAPLLIFIFSGIVAIGGYVLDSRPTLQVALTSGGAALIALFSWFALLNEPIMLIGIPIKVGSDWLVLGRTFTLNSSNRAAIGFLYLVGTFVFGGGWASRRGRTFYVAGLAALAFVAASLSIQPFLYAAIFLEFAAMAGVLILASRDLSGYRGGMRLLILYSLAMMAVLLAGWMLDRVGVTVASPDYALRATIFLAFGFAVLMAVPPFHLWLPIAASESSPYALTFVTVILQSAGLFFLLRFLNAYAWLRELTDLYAGIRLAGILMVWFGGLLALTQRVISKTMAYALLTDFGVMLLAVSIGSPEGYKLALGLNGIRIVSLGVWAIGLDWLFERCDKTDPSAIRGIAHHFPLAAIATLTGILSIAGFPLTAGFPGRWALLSMLAPIDPFASITMILASFFIGGVAIRWAGILIERPKIEDQEHVSIQAKIILAGGVVMCVLLGLFPQLIYPWVVQAAAGITQYVP